MLREYAAGFLATLVIAFGFFLAIDYAFSLPDVKKSYETGECIEVENYPGTFFNKEIYSCENMPEKFYLVWVL